MNKVNNSQNILEWSNISDNVIDDFGDEGDFFRKHILNPVILYLLGDVKDKKILDAGCGNGYLSRILARQGANVMGIEPASKLYDYAVSKEENENLGVSYLKEDLSVWKPNPSEFDAVVSNMVFMDIPDFEIAIKNCIVSLKPGGAFLFSILHPCFDEEEGAKEYFEEKEVKQTIGYFIHRPISRYINLLSENGCVVEKFEEPQLSKEIAEKFPEHKGANHIPYFLVIKSKKL